MCRQAGRESCQRLHRQPFPSFQSVVFRQVTGQAVPILQAFGQQDYFFLVFSWLISSETCSPTRSVLLIPFSSLQSS